MEKISIQELRKKTAEEAMTEVKAQTDSLVDGTYSGNRS